MNCDLKPDTVRKPQLLSEHALLPSSGAHSDVGAGLQKILPDCDDVFGSISF